MKYTLLAYFDKETKKFNPPIITPIDKDGSIESVIDTCKKGKLEGAEYFVLYFLGTYDTETGKFDLEVEPERITDLEKYVKGPTSGNHA